MDRAPSVAEEGVAPRRASRLGLPAIAAREVAPLEDEVAEDVGALVPAVLPVTPRDLGDLTVDRRVVPGGGPAGRRVDGAVRPVIREVTAVGAVTEVSEVPVARPGVPALPLAPASRAEAGAVLSVAGPSARPSG